MVTRPCEIAINENLSNKSNSYKKSGFEIQIRFLHYNLFYLKRFTISHIRKNYFESSAFYKKITENLSVNFFKTYFEGLMSITTVLL